MIQQFTIPGKLSSLNEYISRCRQSPIAGAALKRKEQDRVVKAITDAGIKPMKTPVDVLIEWFEPNMRRDKDNVRSGIKYILDGLVEAGIIANDGWKHINTITDAYYVNKSDPRVRVTIRECL